MTLSTRIGRLEKLSPANHEPQRWHSIIKKDETPLSVAREAYERDNGVIGPDDGVFVWNTVAPKPMGIQS